MSAPRRAQLGFHAVVAAVQVVDAVDQGLALGHQAGDHQAGRGAQVGRHHGGAGQLLHAFDHRDLAVGLDLGAQAQHLVDVHEAVLEDGLGDARGALGDRVERHELGLHVGREARVLGGAEALRLQAAAGAHADAVLDGSHVAAPASRSLSITASRWSARPWRSSDVAAGGRHRAQEGAGLDAVGHHLVRRSRAGAPRPGCGCGWCRGLRSSRPWRSASRPGRLISGSCAAFSSTVSPSASAAAIRKFSVPVTVTMSVVMRAPCRRLWPACRRGDHVAVLDRDLGAHRLQALDVLVDRARADGAAARQRHLGLAEARQQRTQRQHRRAHGLDQLVGRLGVGEVARVEAHGAVVVSLGRRRPCCAPA